VERQDLIELAEGYKDALLDELKSKIALAGAQRDAAIQEATTLEEATAQGIIDGKNADTRKTQTAGVLANSQTYQNALRLVQIAEDNAGHATVHRQYHDALVSLHKAWLYSQGGH